MRLPASLVPGVGPGLPAPVALNSDGKIVRKTVQSQTLIGSCDADGNVELRDTAQAAALVVNVLEHGAIGDLSFDNYDAFRRARDAGGDGAMIYVPPGRYLMSEALVPTFNQTWFGHANAAGNQSTLVPAARKNGIEISDIGGAGSTFRNLDLMGNGWSIPMGDVVSWPNLPSEVAEGTICQASNDNRYLFIAIEAGTRGSVEPFTSREGGSIGGYAQSGDPEDMLPGDRYLLGMEIADGTVTWQAIWNAGISAQYQVNVHEMGLINFKNAAIAVQSDTDYGNANYCDFDRCFIWFCGVGVWVSGNESNGCTFSRIRIGNTGYYNEGRGGHHLHCRPFLGGFAKHIRTDGSAWPRNGRMYILDNPVGRFELTESYFEGGDRAGVCLYPNKADIPHTRSPLSTGVVRAPGTASGEVFISSDETMAFEPVSSYRRAFASMRAKGEYGAFEVIAPGPDSLPSASPGHYQRAWNGALGSRAIDGLTGKYSPEGIAHRFSNSGNFEVSTYVEGARYTSPRGDAVVPQLRRKAHWLPGDRVVLAEPVDGYGQRVVTAEGHRGTVWEPSTFYLRDDDPVTGVFKSGLGPVLVEPTANGGTNDGQEVPEPDSPVYEPLDYGYGGTTEPDWESEDENGIVMDGDIRLKRLALGTPEYGAWADPIYTPT